MPSFNQIMAESYDALFSCTALVHASLLEHFLFHLLGVTSKSRVKFVDSEGFSISTPDSLLHTVLRRSFRCILIHV